MLTLKPYTHTHTVYYITLQSYLSQRRESDFIFLPELCEPFENRSSCSVLVRLAAALSQSSALAAATSILRLAVGVRGVPDRQSNHGPMNEDYSISRQADINKSTGRQTDRQRNRQTAKQTEGIRFTSWLVWSHDQCTPVYDYYDVGQSGSAPTSPAKSKDGSSFRRSLSFGSGNSAGKQPCVLARPCELCLLLLLQFNNCWSLSYQCVPNK